MVMARRNMYRWLSWETYSGEQSTERACRYLHYCCNDIEIRFYRTARSGRYSDGSIEYRFKVELRISLTNSLASGLHPAMSFRRQEAWALDDITNLCKILFGEVPDADLRRCQLILRQHSTLTCDSHRSGEVRECRDLKCC
jgi:hypothetical protein